MKTIRSKIIVFFIISFAFTGLLTFVHYENASLLQRKIYIIQNFDDLLNDVLELRRHEKNFFLYRNKSSLEEGLVYMLKLEDEYKTLRNDIRNLIGTEENASFHYSLIRYRQILDDIIALKTTDGSPVLENELRREGRYLSVFAENLIQKKRRRIEQTLNRVLIIPLASVAGLVLIIVIIFRFATIGILKPLSLVESATEKVARDSFSPISYDKRRQDEITRLIASFNRMVEELENRQEQLIQSRKLASIGTFTSGIAHELNNPLNNISITAESLMLSYKDIPESEIDEMISDILSQADRASQVVKNLLEFSRTERPFLRDLDVGQVVESAINLIKNQMVVGHVHIEMQIAEDLPAIRGKRQDLQQALVNILLNAIQAMPEGGTITVRVCLDPQEYIRIDLSDTGTGIPPEVLEHVFDPFFTTKTANQGTGLGLSLVYNIIRTHGGYIEVRSEVGQGSTFSIFLPVIGEDDSTDEMQNSGR